MQLILAFLMLVLSFYLMAKIINGQFLKSLDNIAKYLKIPDSVAGATLLSIGTSVPEISTTLVALFVSGTNPGIGVGTIVGSAIFQILVVIGFSAAIKTSYLDWRPVVRESVFYAISIAILILFVRDGKITFTESAIFLSFYLFYLLILYIWTKVVKEDSAEIDNFENTEIILKKPSNIFEYIKYPIDFLINLIPSPEENKNWTIPVFVISLAIVGYTCYWLVWSAETIARILSISPSIVSLTILAGGSSIPELISSMSVSKQGRGAMAISNAIGSNIFDILVSLGLPVFIYTSRNGDLTDIGGENITSSIMLLFATLIMVISILAAQKFKASRKFGIFLILVYVAYVIAAYSGVI